MDPLMLSSILGAAGNVAGGTISTLGQLYANKQNIDLAHQQMQWNEQMMDKQNQQNVDFWNMQNEYNTPAEQVKRMHEAGLYAAGNVDAGNAQSLNAASALGYQNPNVQNPMAGLGQGIAQGSQLVMENALKKAQIENIKANTAKTETETEWLPKLNENTITIANKEIDLKTKLTDAQIKDVESEITTRAEQMRAKWEELEIENGKLDLANNQFEAEQFWKAAYYVLDQYKLSQDDRRIAIAGMEAMTHSKAVEYEHMDRQESMSIQRLYNATKLGLEKRGQDIQLKQFEMKFDQDVKEWKNDNTREWISSGFEIAETVAGFALLCTGNPMGLMLLGHGGVSLLTGGSKPKSSGNGPSYSPGTNGYDFP